MSYRSMSSSRVGALSPRRGGQAASQSRGGGNCSRRSSLGSGTTSVETLAGMPSEASVHAVPMESMATRAANSMKPCNRDVPHGKLGHSSRTSSPAHVRGTSRERGVRSVSNGRGFRTPSSANTSTSTMAPSVSVPVAMALAPSELVDAVPQTQWEEFAAHRHQTQLKLEALAEADETQRLADARAQLQVEQLSRNVEECAQDVQAVREQSVANVERLTELNRALESDREALETIRRGLGRLERALRDQVEQQEHHHEAVTVSIKRGDRIVADELLAKMAELNEKLGANMQALEDEVGRDLQMMKEQLSEGQCSTPSDLVAAVSGQSSSQSSSQPSLIPTAHTSAAELSGMLESREDTASTAATYMNCGHISPESFAQEFHSQRARLEELDSKLDAEIAIFRDSRLAMVQEQHTFSEQLQEGLDDVRSACKAAELASASSARSMREELYARLDDARNAREDLAAAVEENLREVREEVQLKLDTLAADGGLDSRVKELLESLRVDLQTEFSDAWEAHKDQAASVESARQELDSIRDQVTSFMVEASQESQRSLEGVVDKAVSGIRDELTEKLDLMKKGHDELVDLVDRDVAAVRGELGESKSLSEYVSQATNGAIGPLRDELTHIRCGCSEISKQTEAFSSFRDEFAEKLGSVLKAHDELLISVDRDLSSLRDELGDGFRSIEAFSSFRVELAEQLDSMKKGHQELSATVERDLSSLREEVDDDRRSIEAFSQCRVELAEQLETLKKGHDSLSTSVDRDLSSLRDELGSIGPLRREMTDLRSACSDMSANAEDIEATKQRMMKFCEEIIEMVTDINNQACSGCVEVQQSLEVAVERLSGSSNEVILRLQALEGHQSSTCCAAAIEEKTTVNPDSTVKNREESKLQGDDEGISVDDTRGRLDALEARVEALGGTLSQDAERFEAWLQTHSNELAAFPAALGDSREQLHAFEEQLESTCTGMQKDKVKLEQVLGNHEARLETISTAVGKMRAQLDISEARVEAACKAAQNTSMNSSPIRWEREVSDCDLVTSPTTFSEAQGHVATLQERLDAMQEATRRQIACLDSRLEIVEVGLRSIPSSVATMQAQLSTFEAQLGPFPRHESTATCSDARCKVDIAMQSLQDNVAAHSKQLREQTKALESLSETCGVLSDSSLQDKVSSLEEQFSALQQSMPKDSMQPDPRLETQASEIANIRRAVSDLTNDVLKTQGLADAAYAEATREQDLTSTIKASAESVWKKYQSERDKAWRVELTDAVQSACEKLSGDMHENKPSFVQQLREELQQQCRGWIDELANQEHCSDGPRSLAVGEESLRSEIEKTRQEATAEAERLWNAIGAQADGVAERSEALALETQHQCRTWVDGALRKLEDLALRTKERIAALASAADRREERLEAKLTAKLTDAGLLRSTGEATSSVDE